LVVSIVSNKNDMEGQIFNWHNDKLQ